MAEYSIILPTYNEGKNIRSILEQIERFVAKDYSYEILFVDDSTDATPSIITQEMERNTAIRLIHRHEKYRTGLATAFVKGFEEAQGKYIVCMDADLQHPPKVLPRLFEAIKEDDDDIVVASRYMKGGSAHGLGTIYRKAVSLFCKYVTRTALPQTQRTTDPGSGFFIFKKRIIQDVPLRPTGFKILIEILARVPDARVSDIPYSFERRTDGDSKATLKQGMQFFSHIGSLFMENPEARVKQIAGKIIFVCIIVISLYYLLSLLITLPVLIALMVVVSIVLSIQGLFSCFAMLYAWENPAKIEEIKSPKKYERPSKSFTAMIPARHEQDVIAQTINAVANIDYPEELKQVLVICRSDDVETIKVAEHAVWMTGKENIELVIFDGLPINKPHGLNIGLTKSKGDIVTIFDAEDEPHKDIYSIINTIIIQKKADIVQSGVQLMNYDSNWYSLFNVLEYFFWFKSTLHFFAQSKVIPLGGNTVFFKRKLLEKAGGWDQDCLTEDADIGIRLSAAKAKTVVVYDEEHVTREETPPSLWSFVKQRTRWNQGFIQIMIKGDWLRLPKLSQKILSLYILLWPMVQTLLFFYLPFSIIIALTVKVSALVALLTNLPLYIVLLYLVIYSLGMHDFLKVYKKRYSLWLQIKLLIFFIPYQIALGLSAFRAVFRQLSQNISWEKTEHVNAHR